MGWECSYSIAIYTYNDQTIFRYGEANLEAHDWPKTKAHCKIVISRGGQKTVDPDPPDQSGRPARPPTHSLAYIRTDTDTDILNIRITDG